ncbi:hypothetical protein BDN72DRAFT_766293, partial [Pluteus cervinus]
QIVNSRAALLSNYEVLTLLRELENEHIERTKAALRVKKEEESTGVGGPKPLGAGGKDPQVIDVSENLRTVEVEAIQYLSADYLPTASQTSAGITQLVKALAPYDLTKAEKLQVVNLAPTLPVELYVIVEEFEDRLGDRMEEILDHVRTSIDKKVPQQLAATSTAPAVTTADSIALFGEEIVYGDQDAEWNGFDYDAAGVDEHIFDDHGEGIGIEGDLDMEED